MSNGLFTSPTPMFNGAETEWLQYSTPQARERFEREAKTISSLSHPHICILHDVGHQDGIDYLVMEYLEGQTLADRLKKGPLPLEQGRA